MNIFAVQKMFLCEEALFLNIQRICKNPYSKLSIRSNPAMGLNDMFLLWINSFETFKNM
jgi:hypothetical protein